MAAVQEKVINDRKLPKMLEERWEGREWWRDTRERKERGRNSDRGEGRELESGETLWFGFYFQNVHTKILLALIWLVDYLWNKIRMNECLLVDGPIG